MPYNTRRKSLSLPSLGIHIPVTNAARDAARAAAASKNAARPTSSSASTSPSAVRSESPESHPNKRRKRSHGAGSTAVEQTPPLSPTPATSVDMADAVSPPKVDLEGIHDDIVAAVILQLQSTANRPHLVKELAVVLAQQLPSVHQSANPCAIISSRISSYMKRSSWSALARCPLAKELEPVHPRRTFFFLTTCPRQPLPDATTQTTRASIITPSVSLTDDSGSDDEGRRRELSPSPEVDLSPPEFDDMDEDVAMPATPIGSLPKHHFWDPRDLRRDSPPLEKDEREFTQTADGLQKRKLTDIPTITETADRNTNVEYGYRDDAWFGDSRPIASTTFLASPAMRPSILPNTRKDEEAESWLKLSKMIEWDKGAESIEIDELDCLLDSC